MYQTIIFDLDGTLLDTLDDLTGAVNHALLSYGLPSRTKEEVKSFIGNGIVKLMQRAVGVKNHPLFLDILQAFKQYYAQHCADNTRPYDGILPLLKALQLQGIKTAVVSNKADFATKLLAEQYFNGLLQESMGENESAGICKKPAPDMLLAVMEKLGAEKQTTLYVGDSEVDIQTAQNAGVACASVTWGFKDERFLRENGAKTLVHSAAELLFLCEIPNFSQAEKQIGNTPLLTLKNIENTYRLQANIYAKAEWKNAGGSIKDRAAVAMINDAEKAGKLQKGGTVVEATSGNTGIGLALVAKARGYKSVIVMPDTMSKERQILLALYGAEVIRTDGKKGMQGAVEYAKTLVERTPNSVYIGQFDNQANVNAHYLTTGREIARQCPNIDILVCGVGTGGTITGVGKYLKECNPALRVVAVEPQSSPLLSKGYAGAHGIQGIGANFVPSILDRTVIDEIVCVSDSDAFEWAKRAMEKENAYVGISSGAALCAAVQLALRKENAGKNIVVIFPDGGGRYLTSGLFD